jgi:hypothetical protein
MPRPKTVSGGDLALYRTANLNFATYLYATQRLAYDHTEAHDRHSEFFFRDPEGRGAAMWIEYCTKDLPVSAKLLLETRAVLLNEIRGVRP